jgi:ABC-type uncharacterized transport system auxiliary subunit
MKIGKFILILILAGAGIAGCAKRAIVSRYYLLENPRPLSPAELTITSPLPYSADVRDFQAGRAFDLTRIAARSSSNELDYYFYHHWASRPSTALADMLYEVIDQAGLFERCTRGYSPHPDLIISGRIVRCERLLQDDVDSAHLAAVLTLADRTSERQIFRHKFDRTTELDKDRSMNGFASAISHILFQEALQFSEHIAAHLEQPSE